MRKLAMLPALLLGACAAASTPIRPTADRTEFSVRIHELASRRDVERACLGMEPGSAGSGPICGCSRFDRGMLEVWVSTPASVEDEAAFATIGHELWHGAKGKFHGPWAGGPWCR